MGRGAADKSSSAFGILRRRRRDRRSQNANHAADDVFARLRVLRRPTVEDLGDVRRQVRTRMDGTDIVLEELDGGEVLRAQRFPASDAERAAEQAIEWDAQAGAHNRAALDEQYVNAQLSVIHRFAVDHGVHAVRTKVRKDVRSDHDYGGSRSPASPGLCYRMVSLFTDDELAKFADAQTLADRRALREPPSVRELADFFERTGATRRRFGEREYTNQPPAEEEQLLALRAGEALRSFKAQTGFPNRNPLHVRAKDRSASARRRARLHAVKGISFTINGENVVFPPTPDGCHDAAVFLSDLVSTIAVEKAMAAASIERINEALEQRASE
jgi:hypothetical protein